MTAETHEALELDRGSGNIFRDLGLPDPDLRQAKAILAASILQALDARTLTVREAAAATGFAAADFSRVRNARLARFTLDRLICMLQALAPEARVTLRVSAPMAGPAPAGSTSPGTRARRHSGG
ncbi:MAG: XRE family transcriptional regulator [Alphaproteobacteria bacterium]|nr:XRE family transcriptional regulator [Alphaproteobacteria bacterium]MCB9930956.1 XRE family transcriptional regulator [Alphaproteobacteria bacterium]